MVRKSQGRKTTYVYRPKPGGKKKKKTQAEKNKAAHDKRWGNVPVNVINDSTGGGGKVEKVGMGRGWLLWSSRIVAGFFAFVWSSRTEGVAMSRFVWSSRTEGVVMSRFVWSSRTEGVGMSRSHGYVAWLCRGDLGRVFVEDFFPHSAISSEKRSPHFIAGSLELCFIADSWPSRGNCFLAIYCFPRTRPARTRLGTSKAAAMASRRRYVLGTVILL